MMNHGQTGDNALSADNQQERPLDPWYVTGFFDGEGCFCSSIRRSPYGKFGWFIQPVVQAYQHRDRADILYRLQRYFGAGKIRPKGPNSNVITLSFDGVPTIISVILPHFDQYPLQSGKIDDYLVFREIVFRLRRKEHLMPQGAIEVVRLAFGTNAQGKQRKYTLAEVESGILRGHPPVLV